MPPKRKLSGAQLLAELGDTLDPASTATAALAPSLPAAAPPGGRPAKVVGKGVPLTVRFSEGQVAALRRAALARTQATEGRVMVTPQDIVRELIDRALADPGFPAILIGEPRS